jgi:hypothetical protein
VSGAVGLIGLALGAPAALAGTSQTIDTKGGFIKFDDRAFPACQSPPTVSGTDASGGRPHAAAFGSARRLS